MHTLLRPDVRPGRLDGPEVLAYVLLALGFVLIVLAIYEVGGLFNLGLGLAVVLAGEIVLFTHQARRLKREAEEFRRIVGET